MPVNQKSWTTKYLFLLGSYFVCVVWTNNLWAMFSFQFCYVAKDNHPQAYLTKFGDTQNMKIKNLNTLSHYKQL